MGEEENCKMRSVADHIIDRVAVPLLAMLVVLPLLIAWHLAAERENARRGIR